MQQWTSILLLNATHGTIDIFQVQLCSLGLITVSLLLLMQLRIFLTHVTSSHDVQGNVTLELQL